MTTKPAAKSYPTLTDTERKDVTQIESDLAAIEERLAALHAERTVLREKRKAIFAAAALRDVTPEQVSLTYRTTGQGRNDLKSFVADLHPYIYDFGIFGPFSGADVALGANLNLCGNNNSPDQVEPLADALARAATLIAPDGGMAYEIDPTTGNTVTPSHEVDWTWFEHANGMHPVDILEDDCGETRSLLLAHSADGTRAVLMDRRNSWYYRVNDLPDGVVATGTLVEVLTVLFREVRENQRDRGDDDED